ncbi:MAG TPA: cysteine desulfurase [Chloroflexi bacterium]|nr:cysteine desulfurase [Chloroflexota bacterium]
MKHDFETPLDVAAVRADFPVLEREVRPGVPLVYLDNAATSQKPLSVIEAMNDYYRRYNANVHRGIHKLSEEATDAYEGARKRIAQFINAASYREIIYTRNTTESINLVAWTWGQANLGPGDVILSTEMEHHSNIVPWQLLARRVGCEVRYVPITEGGELDMEAFHQMLDELPVKLVAVTHMSNVLGTILPVREIVEAAHAAGAVALVDGAQSTPHIPVDVQEMDADFFAFSSHKMLGPTGIGVLYGKRAILEEMPPFLGGGDMIKRVELGKSEWNDLPWKFEAGTPSIAEAIGLKVAIDYLEGVGMENVHAHEVAITAYALERLAEVPGVRVLGPSDPTRKGGVAAIVMDDAHPHDIAQILDHEGIAVRAGHHCAMPLHQRYNVVASARASFYLYNTFEEVDRLIEAIYKVKETLTF